MSRIVDHLTTSANISLKSIPSLCWNPLATIHALSLLMTPFAVRLSLKIHLAVMGFLSLGRSMISHVLFLRIASTSFWMADCHSAC